MGTNYYLKSDCCPHCGRGNESLHIGKSSAGWCFSLHVIPNREINSLDDWRKLWSVPGAQIFDEYDEPVAVEHMEHVILNRSWKGSDLGPDWHRTNHSEPGPNGLARHTIDGRHCIAHGDGTYDLIPGEFS